MAFLLHQYSLMSTIPNLLHVFSVHLLNCYFPNFWYSHVTEKNTFRREKYEEQAFASEQDIGRVAQIDYFISTLEEMDAPVTEFADQHGRPYGGA